VSTRRHLLVLVTALALLAPALPAADAAAATRRVCARQAVLFDSPGGFVTGYLRRGQRVQLLRRDRTRQWASVRTSTRRFGWVRSGALCRA
jgi:hypothetical protein